MVELVDLCDAAIYSPITDSSVLCTHLLPKAMLSASLLSICNFPAPARSRQAVSQVVMQESSIKLNP